MDQDIQELAEAERLETGRDELTNSIVTVSMLQIGLKFHARSLQTRLTDLGLQADTTTPEGLFQLLQQTATALLDNSPHWTHVKAISQTVGTRETAEVLFNQLLFQERSKFSLETLANVNGQITQQSAPIALGEPAYIVVTLLLGTADDQPLFNEIYSASVLRDVLEDITAMGPRYLMVLEILWSPQTPTDSLTEADMAKEYSDMVPIA